MGYLGLICMEKFVSDHILEFINFVEGNQPFGYAIIGMTQLLFDYYYTTELPWKPISLMFDEVLCLLFLKLLEFWKDSRAVLDDLYKVCEFFRPILKHAFSDPSIQSLDDLEAYLGAVKYSSIKLDILKEIKQESLEYLSTKSALSLFDQLNAEHSSVMENVVLSSLKKGDWFTSSLKKDRKKKNIYRYYQLDSDNHFLKWADFHDKSAVPNNVVLTEHLDLLDSEIFLRKEDDGTFNIRTSEVYIEFASENAKLNTTWYYGICLLLHKKSNINEYIKELTNMEVYLRTELMRTLNINIAVNLPVPEPIDDYNFYYATAQ